MYLKQLQNELKLRQRPLVKSEGSNWIHLTTCNLILINFFSYFSLPNLNVWVANFTLKSKWSYIFSEKVIVFLGISWWKWYTYVDIMMNGCKVMHGFHVLEQTAAILDFFICVDTEKQWISIMFLRSIWHRKYISLSCIINILFKIGGLPIFKN